MPYPWEQSDGEVTVVEAYEAEIVGHTGKEFLVEFSDPKNGGLVEAWVEKGAFEGFPYKAGKESSFGIVTRKDKETEETQCSAWPVAEYWNRSLVKR